MRIISRPWAIAGPLMASLLLMSGAPRADAGPVVHVSAVVKDGAVRLEAQASGPFEYTTYRPNDTLFVVDLTGVSAAEPTAVQALDSGLVRSYRLVPYQEGSKPAVRLEVLLRAAVEPRVERGNSASLTLVVGPSSAAASTNDSVAPIKSTLPSSTILKSTEIQSSPSSFEAIEEVRLGQKGDRTEVDVTGTGRLNFHVLRLSHPDRVVLDFAGAHLKASEKSIPSNLDPVREIRLAQFSPDVTRVVIDLRQRAPYSVTPSGNSVRVEFLPAKNSKTPFPVAPETEDSKIVTTRNTVSEKDQAASSVAVTPKDSALALPANLTEPAAALASPVRAKLETASPASSNSTSSGSSAPSKAIVVQGTPASAAAAGKYSGEPISVNLKDVDLHDFFRLIHEISGLNVVVDPAVKGTLTIVLDDVPWDQALDIVLRNNDLDKQLDGNVLRVATKETVKKEAEEARDLAKAQAEAADVVTTTRVLSYAKSDDMTATLKKFLSSRGDILSDSRSNTLIIRDIPSVLPVLDNLIRQLDRKSQQVEIEARVVAANRSFARDIGTQLAFAAGTAGRNNIFGGNTEVGTSNISRFPPVLPPLVVTGGSATSGFQMPLSTNLPAQSPTSGISYLFSSRNFALDYVITAAEEKGVGKLLSKPKVITQNNQRADVKQGTKIPIQTIVNNTVSVQFIDVVLELLVTPQITADGNVFMEVRVINDQIDPAIPRVNGIPAIDTQAAETRVLIGDGGTVVIGGIIISNQRTDVQQVPLFGSLPLIGNLFRRNQVNSTSQELLFFLTPRILPG
ncbi:MAG: type IV pilus secretin PilQ [Candidatus Acidiferrales bacterium]